MNSVERVKAICKERKIPISKLEKECGFSNGYIGQLRKGVFPDDRLSVISRYLNVSSEFLMHGYESDSVNPDAQEDNKKGYRIPVLGDVAAGIPFEAVEDILDWEEISPDMAKTGEFFGLKIRGNSMSPRIVEGDVVIVKQQPDAETGSIVIAKVNGDDACCKRLIKNQDGITLQSFNPDYAPMYFSRKEIEDLPVSIIGRVVELRGKC